MGVKRTFSDKNVLGTTDVTIVSRTYFSALASGLPQDRPVVFCCKKT